MVMQIGFNCACHEILSSQSLWSYNRLDFSEQNIIS